MQESSKWPGEQSNSLNISLSIFLIFVINLLDLAQP